MTLGALHTRLRNALGKGTSLDSVIVSEVAAAARHIEQQRTYQYMKRFGYTTISLDSDFPNMIEAPPNLKALQLVRIVIGGRFYRVTRANDHNQMEFTEGFPNRYDLDGAERIVFNALPTEAWRVELRWDEYTAWPLELTATNWLLQNGANCLFYQTLIQMSADLRDPRQRQNLQALRDEAFRAMLIADEELQNADVEAVMRYTPEGGIDLERYRGY